MGSQARAGRACLPGPHGADAGRALAHPPSPPGGKQEAPQQPQPHQETGPQPTAAQARTDVKRRHGPPPDVAVRGSGRGAASQAGPAEHVRSTWLKRGVVSDVCRRPTGAESPITGEGVQLHPPSMRRRPCRQPLPTSQAVLCHINPRFCHNSLPRCVVTLPIGLQS